jgi:hypothetical protein
MATRHGRIAAALLVLALVLALPLPPPALAEEKPPGLAPPKARTFDLDFQAARGLLRAERWVDASRALQRLFEDYRNSPEVIRRIGDIEEDLKLATFRSREPAPKPEEIFGPGARTFDPSSRKLVLDFPEGPVPPAWKGAEDGLQVLPLRFDEVTLEFEEDFSGMVSFFLSWDPDARSGYVVIPGFYGATRYQNAVLLRIEGEKKTELASRSDPSFGDGRKKGKLVRTSGGLTLAVDGVQRVSAQDTRAKRGYLGIRPASMRNLVIRGVAEAMQYKALLASHVERRYRAWAEEAWDREKMLPAWTLGAAPVARNRPRLSLPSDAPTPIPDDLASALESWRQEDIPGFMLGLPGLDDLPPLTRGLIEGLSCFVAGKGLEAEGHFTSILDAQADFGPALLYRGLSRLRRRDLDGARADLEKARAGAGAQPELWIGLANLAIAEGNLEGAHQALSEARTKGAVDGDAEELAVWVRRSLRGPAWAKRFEARGRYAIVATDHSQDLAAQVLKTLDTALGNCASLFPKGKKPAVPVRVQVFSSREGFLGYAEDLGRDLDSAAGAYNARVHEMVLFVPDVSRDELWATVRHESFHAFIHGFLQDVPTWLDEGWAQCLERGKVDFGTIRMAPIEPELIERIDWKVNVAGVMAMDHRQFMKGAKNHYPIAQALVTFLFVSEKPRYRERLQGYLESLRTGLSAKEAYDRHFQPVIVEITEGFHRWMRAGGKVPGK